MQRSLFILAPSHRRCNGFLRLVAIGIGLLVYPAASAAPLEYHFNIWNWTKTYRDLPTFERRVRWAERTGFTLIELSVAWRECQPGIDRFDFSELDKRLEIIRRHHLAVRIRVNLYYADGWPEWLEPVFLENPSGEKPLKILTFFDPGINKKADRFLAELVKHLAGKSIRYSPFFGMHAEVKFGGWLGYGPSGQAAWRRWLTERFESAETLSERWGKTVDDIDKLTPPILPETAGRPDLDLEHIDWITFREDVLADRVLQFSKTVRTNDSAARVSIPLGEGLRRGAAEMANLAYARYAEPADEIVHSLDFFWHAKGGPATAAVSGTVVAGMTNRPVFLEIDGPNLQRDFHYTEEKIIDYANAFLDAGGRGLQIANYAYEDFRDEKYPLLKTLGREIARRNRHARRPARPKPADITLVYLSKWTNYTFREKARSSYDPEAEWVYARQTAPIRTMLEARRPFRVITDENLTENLLLYRAILLPFAPVMAKSARDTLADLARRMPVLDAAENNFSFRKVKTVSIVPRGPIPRSRAVR